MSRYRIPSKNAKHNVYIGWDNPMQTFFAQVTDPTLDEEHQMVFWTGGMPEEVGSVETLQESLKPYADIPEDVKGNLVRDHGARTEPTPLQKLSARLFKEALDED